jgi:hypothetical protein
MPTNGSLFQILTFLVSFNLLSCNPNERPFTADDNARVIFPSDIKTMLAPTPTWQPSLTKVKECEAALKKQLIRNDSSEIAKSLDTYRFQYIGYGESRTRILMNAFCKETFDQFPEWRSKWVSVLDGGTCFFDATCNSTTQEISDLFFHASP